MKYILEALKGKNDWWRIMLVSIPFLFLFLINLLIYLFLTPEELKLMLESGHLSTSNNLNLINSLLPFVVLLGVLLVFFRLIHQRSLLSLTTSRKIIDFKRILLSILIIGSIQILFFTISYFYDNSNIEYIFNPEKFAVLTVICIALLPLQIGFEEYFFRGYLLQHIGIKTNSIWIPIITTSILFGIAHIANPEIAELGFEMMIFYVGTGLVLAIMTILDEGLELAIGFHFINNFIAAALITSDFSILKSDAIFKYTSEIDKTSLFNETLISIAIAYPFILFIFGKIYKWDWKQLLRK